MAYGLILPRHESSFLSKAIKKAIDSFYGFKYQTILRMTVECVIRPLYGLREKRPCSTAFQLSSDSVFHSVGYRCHVLVPYIIRRG